MRKQFRHFLALLLTIATMMSCMSMAISAAAPEEKKVLKVLAIGNSFSEDATQHMYQIAQDCGADEIIIGNLYWGGCSLATHWNNAQTNNNGYDYQKNTNGVWTHRNGSTIEYAVEDEDWDYITLQQVSGLSGEIDTYNSDLTNLINYVNQHKTNPDAKLGWHMTWAYQQNSNHGDFGRYNKDQMTMYNAIVNCVKNRVITNDNFDFVVPAGTAIQNLRTSYIGDTLTRDGYHMSYNLGRYVAGLTWIKAITGWSIDDVVYVPNIWDVPSEYLPAIKEAVNNAVANPFGVTNSTYKQKPAYTDPNTRKINSLSANGVNGTWRIDGNSNMIILNYPENTNVTALNPQIGISSNARISPTGPQDFTNPVRYTVTAQNGTQQVYIVRADVEKTYDLTGYNQLKVDFGTATGYWNTGNGGYADNPQPAHDRNDFIYTTKRFTKNDIPVGSIIVIDNGYQYRPEGWAYQGDDAPGRPGEVTSKYFVVTANFWAHYQYRSFNIAVKGTGVDISNRIAEVASHFRIYVPGPEVAARKVEAMLDKLPDAGDVTVYEHADVITSAQKAYNNLTSEEKWYVPADKVAALNACVEALAEIRSTYVKYEAENAALIGDARVYTRTNSDLSGNAGVENLGAAGGSVQFTVNADNAGERYIDIYYATYTNREIHVSVNGGAYTSVMGAGNNTDWFVGVNVVSVLVDLKKGTNTITITNTNDWAPQIDYINVPDVAMNQRDLVLYGDVDNNGVVNVNDMTQLKTLILAKKWTDEQLLHGDMNKNNKLDVADILLINRIIL